MLDQSHLPSSLPCVPLSICQPCLLCACTSLFISFIYLIVLSFPPILALPSLILTLSSTVSCSGSAAGIFMTNSFDMVDSPRGMACGMYVALARYVRVMVLCSMLSYASRITPCLESLPLFSPSLLLLSLLLSLPLFSSSLSLNHSCVPNAQQTHVPSSGSEVLYASRKIVIGKYSNDLFLPFIRIVVCGNGVMSEKLVKRMRRMKGR